MALQPPTPFVRPPSVLKNLIELFEAGLKGDSSEILAEAPGREHGMNGIFDRIDIGGDFEQSFNEAIAAAGRVSSSNSICEVDDEEDEEFEPHLVSLTASTHAAEPRPPGSRLTRLLSGSSMAFLPKIVATPPSPLNPKKPPVLVYIPVPTLSIPNFAKLKRQKRSQAMASQVSVSIDDAPNDHRMQHGVDPDITGFTILPLAAECLWTDDFPGNTPGLCQTLLTWHSTMNTLYQNYNLSDRLMNIHPLFPYRPVRPTNITLTSISFWDTSVEPHRELKFFGPGDVATMIYGEVDTLAGVEEEGVDVKGRRHGIHTKGSTGRSSNYERMMRMNEAESKTKKKTEKHNADTCGRSERSEGRWTFVVIKGLLKEGEEGLAPWLTLAWPTAAVTKTSECLLTIYPDEVSNPFFNSSPNASIKPTLSASSASTLTASASALPPPLPTPAPRYPLTRMATIPYMANSGFSTTPIFYKQRPTNSTYLPFPTSSSVSGLPPYSGAPCCGTQKDAWTVKRTSMLFQHAGRSPLIEGYRTDVTAWKGFMEVVGKGKGKIMMFTDT